MSILKVTGAVFGFLLGFILLFFGILFVTEIGQDEVVNRIDNITTSVEDDLGLSDEMKQSVHSLPVQYANLNYHYDLFFLLSIIIAVGFSLFTSYKSKEESTISFFGIITFGIIGVLFVSSFINVIAEWLISNFIIGFLEFNLDSTPIINWYLTYYSIINFLWILLIILVNKFNFTNNREEDEEDLSFRAEELPPQFNNLGRFDK